MSKSSETYVRQQAENFAKVLLRRYGSGALAHAKRIGSHYSASQLPKHVALGIDLLRGKSVGISKEGKIHE